MTQPLLGQRASIRAVIIIGPRGPAPTPELSGIRSPFQLGMVLPPLSLFVGRERCWYAQPLVGDHPVVLHRRSFIEPGPKPLGGFSPIGPKLDRRWNNLVPANAGKAPSTADAVAGG